ncbi:MAG: uracil-DNA glycosylase family protein [Armatimonadota bacterium]
MSNLQQLLAEMEAEARRGGFPIDVPVYERAGRDPYVPVAYAGALEARVCSFGRDPGRDEVRLAQPQVGAAGRRVREGVLQAVGETPPPDDRYLESALRHVFLSNTVPYKPPGNKAYPDRVKERFRPLVARLLTCHWQGDVVLTLGTEAFRWFGPFAPEGALDELWAREDRYEAELTCEISAEYEGERVTRRLTVCPLPHPSPLNQRWLAAFPELLQRRLARWLAGS